jgi:hypothetical protein
VLRDIDNLLKSGGVPNFGQTPWFREVREVNEQNGQEYRYFEMRP